MAKQVVRHAYTSKEVAKMLKVSRATFYRWNKAGKISIGKIGPKYRASDVLKALIKLESI